MGPKTRHSLYQSCIALVDVTGGGCPEAKHGIYPKEKPQHCVKCGVALTLEFLAGDTTNINTGFK